MICGALAVSLQRSAKINRIKKADSGLLFLLEKNGKRKLLFWLDPALHRIVVYCVGVDISIVVGFCVFKWNGGSI